MKHINPFKHTTADNYEHFLSYMHGSGARHNALLCKAYFDGSDAPHEEYEAYMAAHPEPVKQEPAHPDDEAVDLFAAAMKAKLAKKRAEGRGGWDDKERCSAEFLNHLLNEHVGKGDPVDVGNLAMMLWNRGERTTAEPVKQEPVLVPFTKEQIERYATAYDKAFSDAGLVKQEPVAFPNLQPVINWLENGCDPKEAAKELRIYQEKMKAAPIQHMKNAPVAWRCRYCNTDMPTEHASDCPIEICRLPNEYAAPVQPVNQEPVAWYAKDNLEERDEIEVIWTRLKPPYAEVWIPLYEAPINAKSNSYKRNHSVT